MSYFQLHKHKILLVTILLAAIGLSAYSIAHYPGDMTSQGTRTFMPDFQHTTPLSQPSIPVDGQRILQQR
ncbi:hypothetical protein [Paenibacillus sp. N3.4]|uniref:hypothetical protein n=1 Tax=Paenibacillus sp. N3.4 TaxID=2603222 RepID=UPI0011C9C869|nr:hypothetical protein [Paenibacillus sp. N3.4]TXK80617.1 hypothetical protein FU659_18105 [Paenibacillus sp. N3.4]